MTSRQVSVITPFFNAEKFLAEAVESVLGQTFQDWELLLVDDGSTDASSEIAREFAFRFPERVRLFEHDAHRNRGKSSSRNLGLKNAKGRYIVFLDADDVLLPHKFERQAALLEANPIAAVVYGRTRYWHGWIDESGDGEHDRISELGVQAGRLFSPPALLTLFVRNGGLVPCLCALLIRRDVIESVGGFEETIQHLYEDQVLIAKICAAGNVLVDDRVGEQYRQHPDSSSAIAVRTGEYDPRWPNPARLTFLSWLVKYIREQNIQNRELDCALTRELRPYQHPRLYFWLTLPWYGVSLMKGYARVIARQFNTATRWAS